MRISEAKKANSPNKKLSLVNKKNAKVYFTTIELMENLLPFFGRGTISTLLLSSSAAT